MNETEVDQLDALLALEDGLSEWELSFIEDLSHRRERPLTDKQADKLRDIYEKLC